MPRRVCHFQWLPSLLLTIIAAHSLIFTASNAKLLRMWQTRVHNKHSRAPTESIISQNRKIVKPAHVMQSRQSTQNGNLSFRICHSKHRKMGSIVDVI